MPPKKSVQKIVEFIKTDYEEWGGELQIDEASLFRHVEEMLDLEREPPESAPAEIAEEHVRSILAWEVTVTDMADNETRTGRLATEEEIRTAADWAWVIFRDFFGEYPPTGDEDGYCALLHRVLEMRRPHIVEQLPPLS
jgi:hypothetical protein